MVQIKKYVTKDNQTRFMFNVYVGKHPKTKKNVYRKRQGFRTKKQAQIALANLIKDIEENGLEDQQEMTFKELYDMWLKQHRLNARSSSIGTNKNYIEHRIMPHFKDMLLSDISVAYCQKVLNNWFENGYKSYKTYRKLTTQILRYAVVMELISDNPMSKTILPRKKETDNKLKYYTKDDLEHFFKCVEDKHDYKQLAFFRLLAFTGCRKSEILSLQWKDINFLNQSIDINKTLAIDENAQVVIQKPKTLDSIRNISIDHETLLILKKWRSIQKIDYFKMGFNSGSDTQFLFTTLKNNIYNPKVANDWLNNIIKTYSLPKITPHHFRHTHASLLLQAGVPIKEVSERLGHKNIKITLEIYSHVMPDEAKETGNKFATFVGF